jgi:NADH-quinone oxidoreductase subunit L
MLAGVVLTALYMTRQMLYVFFGPRRAAAEHAHESPAVMTLPLVVLGACVVLLSLVLTPAWPWLERFLAGETAAWNSSRLFSSTLLVALGLVTLGIGLGVALYRRNDLLEETMPGVFRFLARRMWLDELYAITVIALARGTARLADLLDRYLWDGLASATSEVARGLGSLTKSADERGINGSVNRAAESTRGLGRQLSGAHSGQVQNYLGAIAIAMVALLLLYAWLT